MEALRMGVDPVRLLSEMRTAQRHRGRSSSSPIRASRAPPRLACRRPRKFLAGLRTTWREGEVRSTAQPKPKKDGRRRPDPLVAMTAELRAWFDADPSRTRREQLERLQAEPGQLRSAAADAPAPG